MREDALPPGFDAQRVAVVAGDGVVARHPGLVCVARCPDGAVLRRLLDLCAAAAGPDPGRTLARRLAMWLAGPDAPGEGLVFGTVAAAGEQVAVFLSGAAEVAVGADLRLSGVDAAAWTDRLLSRPDSPVTLTLGAAPAVPPAEVFDLRGGVVPGAGVVLVPARTEPEGAPAGGPAVRDAAAPGTRAGTAPDGAAPDGAALGGAAPGGAGAAPDGPAPDGADRDDAGLAASPGRSAPAGPQRLAGAGSAAGPAESGGPEASTEQAGEPGAPAPPEVSGELAAAPAGPAGAADREGPAGGSAVIDWFAAAAAGAPAEPVTDAAGVDDWREVRAAVADRWPGDADPAGASADPRSAAVDPLSPEPGSVDPAADGAGAAAPKDAGPAAEVAAATADPSGAAPRPARAADLPGPPDDDGGAEPVAAPEAPDLLKRPARPGAPPREPSARSADGGVPTGRHAITFDDDDDDDEEPPRVPAAKPPARSGRPAPRRPDRATPSPPASPADDDDRTVVARHSRPGEGGPHGTLADALGGHVVPAGRLVLDDGTAYPVDAGYLVGRLPQADPRVRSGAMRPIVVDDPSGAVSRVHAEVRLSGRDVLVEDCGSRNGTFVAAPGEAGWTPLTPGRPWLLVPGSRVRLGGRILHYDVVAPTMV